MHEIKEKIKEKIDEVVGQGIEMNNIDVLGKLVDIHKDISNEEYWDKQKGAIEMNYRGRYGRDEYGEYGEYGRRGVKGTGRGRYGRRGNYRGEEMLDSMYSNYGEYSDSREEYERGNYGAKDETLKSLECMLDSIMNFVEYLKGEAGTEEEVALIREYTREIGKM